MFITPDKGVVERKPTIVVFTDEFCGDAKEFHKIEINGQYQWYRKYKDGRFIECTEDEMMGGKNDG